MKLEAKVIHITRDKDGSVSIHIHHCNDSGAVIKCHRSGLIELYEISMYGGCPHLADSAENIPDAVEAILGWT